MSPAPTAVPAAQALLGMVSSVKVRLGRGGKAGGALGRQPWGLSVKVAIVVSWFPDSHCSTPGSVGAGEDVPPAGRAADQAQSLGQSPTLDSECMEPSGCGEQEHLLTSVTLHLDPECLGLLSASWLEHQ